MTMKKNRKMAITITINDNDNYDNDYDNRDNNDNNDEHNDVIVMMIMITVTIAITGADSGIFQENYDDLTTQGIVFLEYSMDVDELVPCVAKSSTGIAREW